MSPITHEVMLIDVAERLFCALIQGNLRYMDLIARPQMQVAAAAATLSGIRALTRPQMDLIYLTGAGQPFKGP